MRLATGTRLGSYEILSPLGAGGMGEVYRARDTQLGRDVALKVLPEALARDPERMARFKREAQVLAALNHSNIAAIYGFEESDGVRALVMELVEGTTLSERLKYGPLPLDDSLGFARQIAEALEAAHDHGFIHRDLKPANVKIAADGAVKVLDFGLAKALTADDPASSVSNSPTLTIAATQAGVILGTAAYMSPEQAKGKSVDRRADIWAFGCVLYEMLSGAQAFTGETVTDVLAGVIRADPDWDAIPTAVPARIRALLRRCLVKDPKHRLQAIGEARIAIEEAMAGDTRADLPRPEIRDGIKPSLLHRALPWAVATGVFFAVSVWLALDVALRKPNPQPSIRASIGLPANVAQPRNGFFSISPDGRRLAFEAVATGGTDARGQLWVRPLDSLTAQPLAGTEGAEYPFWSPDSGFIGFFAQGKLKKIDSSGGPAQTICDAPDGRGGTWGPSGTIVFAPGVFTGIFEVPSIGGTPVQLTSPSNPGDSDRFPSFLPDGRHVLFLRLAGSSGKDQVSVASLDTKEVKAIIEVHSNALYDRSGYLLYQREGNLVAQRFDPDKFSLSGDSFPVVEQLESNSGTGAAYFSVSSDGMLVYQSGEMSNKAQLTWFDRDGKRLGTLGQPAQIFLLAVSPDVKRVVASIGTPSGKGSLWMFDAARGIASRFTFTDTDDEWPVWSPDDKQVAYTSDRGGRLEIYLKAANGMESEKPLVTGEGESMATDWSRDGRYLAYQTQSRATNQFDLWILPMTGDQKPFPFIATKANELAGAFSPDGRWFAYVSDETGRDEVYVVPFPGRSGKWQVSSSGGSSPFWAGGGAELDYFTPDHKWAAVEVNGRGNDFSIGATQTLFGGKPIPGFRGGQGRRLWATLDGKRLLVPVEGENASVPFTLVTNWFAAIKK
ncbi:MAG TPA: protein kinase [Terriglobia bacterium]|nr:protein kinase [Terriglobia bacterium]